MSYYYTYYIGYLDGENKIHPLGPYDSKGKLHPVIDRSRSYASDLHEDFRRFGEDQVSDDYRKEFEYDTYINKNETRKELDLRFSSYLPLEELGSTDYIKTGYFLIEDVNRYKEEGYDPYGDLFYDRLAPEAYVAKVENELKFGKPGPVEDEYGEKYTTHSAADYMYFAFPDYSSREYEASVIKGVAEMLKGYDDKLKLIVILQEG